MPNGDGGGGATDVMMVIPLGSRNSQFSMIFGYHTSTECVYFPVLLWPALFR